MMNKNSTNYPEVLYEKLKELNDEDTHDNIKQNLFNYQQGVYNYMTKTDQRGILLYHSVGSGKCMKIDTPILMYDGSIKKIQYIQIGDIIMGDDSKPRNILSLARGVDRMYDVIYNNGDSYTVNESHILCLKATIYPELISIESGYKINWIENNMFKSFTFLYKNSDEIKHITTKAIEFISKINYDQIIEISILDYLNLSDSIKKILKGYKTPILFSEKKITLDPYVIGIWLGDNNTDKFNILKEKECKFKSELLNLNLINNKHIPLIYKCNSKANQLKLLAGILDSMGVFSKKKGFKLSFDKINKNVKLCEDIIYLCRSLGFLCYTKTDKKKINKIFIYGKGIDEIPVLEFKDNLWKSQISDDRDGSSGTKIQIKYKNIDNYFGFMIDGNSRYVLGDFTVTHNTITSISIAEHFRKLNRDIIIISSKSLQNNYRKEISGFSKKLNPDINDEEIEEIISKYKFVTSNAKNMIKALETSNKTNGGKDLNHRIERINEMYEMINANGGADTSNKKSKKGFNSPIENILTDINKSNLENKIIIIDEAHNLFNSISNGSKIANEFYDIIMDTKNVKLIFLTGTPIINNPFEIAICFNLLYGPIFKKSMKTSKNKKKDYISIMPEYYTDFQKFFINESENGPISIKNEDKFQNRIFGLVSYYGDLYFEKQSNISDELKKILKKENYPDRLPVKFKIIDMSQLQNIEYSKAREIEKRENSSFFTGGAIFKEKNAVSTSYRIKSRQLSNIYIPDSIKLEKFNINKYSPKLEKMFDIINKNYSNSISLVYSTFLEYGIKAFSKILELNNYKLYDPNEEYIKGVKYFALFSGDQTLEEKEDILKRLNLDENKYGELISVLLISKSGTEGLDLKCIKSVHIMESGWNFSLIQQVIARAVRYKSHISLPEEERNVQTYIYLSDYNKDFLENEKNKLKEKQKKSNKKLESIELTTDISMFKNTIKKQEIIYKFLKLIASTSIECPTFNKLNLNFDCFSCISNNKELFYEDMHRDMELSNSCIKSKKIKAEEIIVNEQRYFYTKEGNEIEVYKYSEIQEGYNKINNLDIINKIKNSLKLN